MNLDKNSNQSMPMMTLDSRFDLKMDSVSLTYDQIQTQGKVQMFIGDGDNVKCEI